VIDERDMRHLQNKLMLVINEAIDVEVRKWTIGLPFANTKPSSSETSDSPTTKGDQ
jgi:hypothetical protein